MVMKKILFDSIFIITAIIIGIIFIEDIKLNQNINIKKINTMWNLYDININEIKENMNEITESNDTFDWWKLKNIKTEDILYKDTLDLLVKDIRMCFLELEDNNELYTDSNYAKKFKNSNTISKNELIILKEKRNDIENTCIDRLKLYKNIDISTDQENEQIFLNEIENNVNFGNKYFIKDKTEYYDYVYNEIIETQILSDISEFLLKEYKRLK